MVQDADGDIAAASAPERAASAGPNWERWLFAALALLSLLPLWTVRYLPTTDGPCHLYNAFVLDHLDDPAYPLFGRFFEVNASPVPNWLSHAALSLLLHIAPPTVAEKLLLSGYVLLFLYAVWSFTGSVAPERRLVAFLAIPFAYHQLLQWGFYNFAISVPLFLLAVGCFWRHRHRPSLAYAWRINLLLLIAYSAHLLSTTLALVAIAVLWLGTLRRDTWKRQLLHVAILAPQAVLPFWYLWTHRGATDAGTWTFGGLALYLGRIEVLYTFGRKQLVLGGLLMALFLAAIALTLAVRRRSGGGRGGWRGRLREEDGFLLLAALFVALYFVSPDASSGGSVLHRRLSLYPFLVLLPWLAPRLSPRLRGLAVCGLAALAALNVIYLVHWYRFTGREVASYVRGMDPIPPHKTVLPLLFNRNGSAAETAIFGHASAYAAIEKGLLDWDDYESTLDYFPIVFRPWVDRPNLLLVEANPHGFYFMPYRERVSYIYTWGMPKDAPVAQRILHTYRLISESGPGRVYERKNPPP